METIPMVGPPDPLIPDLLLAAAAKLGFRVLTRDAAGNPLGVLSGPDGDRALVLAAGDGPGRCRWALLDGAMPKMAYTLSQDTYNALREGKLSLDGALVYQGVQYRLRASFDGIAELVEEKMAV
jgi:hypothetical protein